MESISLANHGATEILNSFLSVSVSPWFKKLFIF
jgi:hypothetical protein